MRPTMFLLAVLAVTAFSTARAQEPPPIEPGAQIRVTAPSVGSDRIVGTVESWESEQLGLDAEKPYRLRGTLTFPIDSIIKLEISRGKKSYLEEGAGCRRQSDNLGRSPTRPTPRERRTET